MTTTAVVVTAVFAGAGAGAGAGAVGVAVDGAMIVTIAMIVIVAVFLQAVLRAICASTEAAGSVKSASSSMQSFYAVQVSELLLASQPVSCLLTLSLQVKPRNLLPA